MDEEPPKLSCNVARRCRRRQTRWPARPARGPRTRSTIIAVVSAQLQDAAAQRCATLGPTLRPMRVLPVALTSGTSGESTSLSPTSQPPMSTWQRLSGQKSSPRAASRAAWCRPAPSAASFSDGFQRTRVSAHQSDGRVPRPDRHREVECRDHAAQPPRDAKSPSFCAPGAPWRSSCRRAVEISPTAKSQISIISWTSPSPSERIFPALQGHQRPRSACARAASRQSV